MAASENTGKRDTLGQSGRMAVDLWLIVILVIAFIIRLYGLTDPLVDFSSWRQVDTASIARNFAEHDFNILHPQLEYDGPGPNYGQLELQITTFLIALIYKLAGINDAYARLVPALFFMGAVIYLYRFVKRYSDRLTANLSALIFSMLPMGVFYSRAAQPESAMLFFGIASLYYFSSWCDKQTGRSYLLATVTGALSVLAKLPNIFLFIPVLMIAWERFGARLIKNRWIILYFAIILTITIGYFGYLGWLVSNFGSPYDYHNYTNPGERTGAFVSNITRKHVLPQLLAAPISPESIDYFKRFLPGLVFTPLGLALFFISILPIRMRGIGAGQLRPLYAWVIAMVIYALTIVSVIRIDYYLIPILPIASFFIARALASLGSSRLTQIIMGTLVAIMAFQSYTTVAPLYKLDMKYYRFGMELGESLRSQEPIILGTYNPAILYYSGHRGWRSDDVSLEEFKYLLAQGAGYYVPLNSMKDKQFVGYLKKNYRQHKTKSGCIYYDLKK
ncbi:MAG TPA: glycosyltransferase family 39 protein [Anaerolineae bacterium]|jgi:4-amino-4-deoxy-L-arabinose transferase-like glycosyltransferase|nr:glycosyltransferase family 39 protein [Anaerolineae bacterium]